MTKKDKFKQKAMIGAKTRFNWIDTLIFSIIGFALTYIKVVLLPTFSGPLSYIARPIMILVFIQIAFFYVLTIRPKVFINQTLNKFLLLPLPVRKRKEFAIVGALAILTQYSGAMFIITSPIWGPDKDDILNLKTDEQIMTIVTQDAKRALIMEKVNALANAKPVDTSKLSPVEVHKMRMRIEDRKNNPEREKQEAKSYRETFIESKVKELFPVTKKRIHSEQTMEYNESIEFAKSQVIRFLKFGFILLLIGGAIDKLNNMILIYLSKRRDT
jgi:hypothetical protein